MTVLYFTMRTSHIVTCATITRLRVAFEESGLGNTEIRMASQKPIIGSCTAFRVSLLGLTGVGKSTWAEIWSTVTNLHPVFVYNELPPNVAHPAAASRHMAPSACTEFIPSSVVVHRYFRD